MGGQSIDTERPSSDYPLCDPRGQTLLEPSAGWGVKSWTRQYSVPFPFSSGTVLSFPFVSLNKQWFLGPRQTEERLGNDSSEYRE